MSKTGGIVELTVFLAVIIILIALVYLYREKKKKREIKKKFRTFTENYRLSHQDMRTVPRITVPDSMEITLKLTDDKYLGLKAHAVDMSLSGFAVKPDFPLKRLPLKALLKNVLVETPINTFVVREMRTVRIDQQVNKRLLAFHIEKIDGDQFEYLKTFIAYLDNFLKKHEEEETV
jgi:hypothetical protein